MPGSFQDEARRALAAFPRGAYLLTAAFEQKRSGQIVHSAQSCADEPMLVCIAARKGHPIAPLIRDAHQFAVCLIDPADKLLLRNFGAGGSQGRGDPFDALELERLATGAPVLKRSLAALDCQVIRHLDVEADHELYIGQVLAGRVYSRRVSSGS
jgi:flavin reductase (DIM6/NTAB) family NADH-FMN oxidoreductase RutF